MTRLQLRIGTRLGLAAGLAVILALGLIVNQQIGGSLVTESQSTADRQTDVNISLLRSEVAMRGAALATRALRTEPTLERVEKSSREVQESLALAGQYLDEAVASTPASESREPLTRLKTHLDAYRAAADSVATTQRDTLNSQAQRDHVLALWSNTLSEVLSSPALKSLPERAELEQG